MTFREIRDVCNGMSETEQIADEYDEGRIRPINLYRSAEGIHEIEIDEEGGVRETNEIVIPGDGYYFS